MIDRDRGFLPDASVEGPPFDTLNPAGSQELETCSPVLDHGY